MHSQIRGRDGMLLGWESNWRQHREGKGKRASEIPTLPSCLLLSCPRETRVIAQCQKTSLFTSLFCVPSPFLAFSSFSYQVNSHNKNLPACLLQSRQRYLTGTTLKKRAYKGVIKNGQSFRHLEKVTKNFDTDE